LGHQLYLYDKFLTISNSSGNNLIPISGFITPAQITGETDAVKMTAFVGEGDKITTPIIWYIPAIQHQGRRLNYGTA